MQTWNSYGAQFIFLFRLNDNGQSVHGKTFKSHFSNYASDLSLNEDGSLFLLGQYSQYLHFGTDSIHSNNQYQYAIFIIKFDSLNAMEWHQIIKVGASSINNRGNSILTDQSNNVYVTGTFGNFAQFGTKFFLVPNTPIFLTRISKCNNFQAEIQTIGDSIICRNSSIELFSPTAYGYAYQWLRHDQEIPGEIYPNLLSSDTGSYSVIVNNNGCIDTSRTITITADSLPQVSLAPFSSVCASDTAFVLGGGSPMGGTWFGNGVSNGYFDPSVADTGWVKISYVYSNGTCSDTASQNIYVSPVPNASITGPTSVCAFSTGSTYTANSSQNLNYNWNVIGGSITFGQGTSSISVDWGAAGAGTVTLTAFRFNPVSPCDTIVIRDSILIDNPQFNANIQGADSVCTNTSYTYSVPSNGILYQWQVTGGQIISGLNTSSINIKWNTAGQGTIYLKMFNSCFNDTILRDTVVIDTGAAPTIAGNASVCSGSNEVYSAGTTNSTYQWSVTGGTIAAGQGSSSIIVNWGNASSGTVSLKESIANSCTASDSIPVTITTVNTSVNQRNDTLFALAGAASFQWLECNLSNGSFSVIPGETASFLHPNKTGSYAVEVTRNSCIDTSICTPIIITDIENNTIAFENIKIYPNPSNGIFTLETTNAGMENIQIQLLGISGKLYFKKDYASSYSITERLDFSHLAKGIYFLKLNYGKGQKVKKIIIQ